MNESDIVPVVDNPPAKQNGHANIYPNRWQPGQTGNPGGSQSAGQSIIGHMNGFAGMSSAQVLAIQQDKNESVSRRAAALTWLETSGADMADFEPYLDGNETLSQLRRSGVRTAAIKKITITDGKNGRTVGVELRHIAGESVDRLMDRTHGKSMQRIEIAAPARHPDQVDADLRALVAANPWLIESITPALPSAADPAPSNII